MSATSIRSGSPLVSTRVTGCPAFPPGGKRSLISRNSSSCSGIDVAHQDGTDRAVVLDQVDERVVGDPGHEQVGDALEGLLEVERCRQQRARVAEQAHVLARPHPVGQVVDRVDGELHAAVGAEDRLGAHERPALLAGGAQPVADRSLLGAPEQRLAPGELLEGERPSLLVEDLEAGADVVPRRGEELLGRAEAAQPRRGVVRVYGGAGRVLGDDPVGDGIQDREQLGGGIADVVLQQAPDGRVALLVWSH